MTVFAERRQIIIGSIICDGFQTEDGQYWMSLSQSTLIVKKKANSISDFASSKHLKSLFNKGLVNSENYKIIEDVKVEGINRGVSLASLSLVNHYWHNQSHKGNEEAYLLALALSQESLERRFDSAFGITRTEAEYNELLAERSQMADRILTLESEQADLERLARTMMENCDRLFEELQASESYAYGLEIQQNAESLYRWHQEHESFLIQSF